MDRIDIHLDVSRPRPEDLLRPTGASTGTAELREGVLRARAFASWRRARDADASPQGSCGEGSLEAVLASCRLDRRALALLEDMARATSMSPRGIVRTLRIARAIADVAEREQAYEEDVAEALGYRVREGIGT